MKFLELFLNKNALLRLDYDFDITEYIDGDIFITFIVEEKIIFSHETQLSYCVNLLLNIFNLILQKDPRVIINEDDFEFQNNYIHYLNGAESVYKKEEYTNIIDFQYRENNGFSAFIFWNHEQIVFEVLDIEVNINKNEDITNNIDYKNSKIVFKESLTIEIVKKWIKTLETLSDRIGSKL